MNIRTILFFSFQTLFLRNHLLHSITSNLLFYQLNFQFRFLQNLTLDLITFDKFTDFAKILQSISNLQHISSLALKSCTWSTFDNTAISEQRKEKQEQLITDNVCDIVRRSDLKTLIISNNGYLKLADIFHALEHRKTLEHLDISSNVLSSHDMSDLLKVLLVCCPPLCKLTLSDIHVNNTHLISRLLDQLFTSHKVKDIDMSGVTLRNCTSFSPVIVPTRIRILTTPTLQYDSLVRLICDNCSLTDHNVSALGFLLRQLVNIKEISLLGNRLGTSKEYALELIDACFISFYSLIVPNLEDLSLTCCFFDTNVIDAMVKRASKCIKLRRLCIATKPCSDLNSDNDVGHLYGTLHKTNRNLTKFSLAMSEEPHRICHPREHQNYWKHI